MCLRDQGINDNNVIVRVRRVCGLSEDQGVVGRGRGICDASEGLDKTTEAAGARRRSQGIYDSEGGVGEGI